jgi:hypothetical protein
VEMTLDQQRAVAMANARLRLQEKPQEYTGANAGIANFGKFLGTAASNIPGSAANFAGDIFHAVTSPVETVTNIAQVGKGALQKAGVMSGEDAKPAADAVGQFFADRYGGSENLVNTMKTDPVGFLSDLSLVLTGGGMAAAKAPGIVGQAGQALKTAGRVVDPLTPVGAAVKGAGHVAAEAIGGLTGTGGKSLRLAAEAGAEGGAKGEAFVSNMRGNADMGSAVSEAKAAVAKLREERGAAYREAMNSLKIVDDAVLDFGKIDAAIEKVSKVKKFGTEDLSPSTRKLRADVTKAIDGWRKLDPATYHTVEGLDALKQKIGDIVYGTTDVNTPARRIGDEIYHGVRNTITEQAPAYAKIMKGYEEASELVKDIEKTLSLNKGASIDTSLRKLQSILRNNVNTNYGKRAELAEYLASAGAPNMLAKLAGQSLNSWLPRGLGHIANTTEIVAAIHNLANGNPKAAAAIFALVPASSPRLAGEVAHGLGKASNLPFRAAGQTSFQLGRMDRALQ